ncbi:MAG: phosphate acyltransferase PlsX [Nitrospirae bacterium]|nr:phosphate acyltransferase PlsX [Candidatus Troglogloeales bacterium]
MKIALDAMGGDDAPLAVVVGAKMACEAFPVELVLVGDEAVLKKAQVKCGAMHPAISIVHAKTQIQMGESPIMVRQKKDASICVATELVKNKEAVAVISAGNTGASMAAAFFILGRLPGIDRPAIATPLPTLKGVSVLIDAGANVDCKPKHLVAFALMGYIYAKDILGIAKPKVGLLNIGEEDSKGNELTKEVFLLLKEAPLNFIGNIEGKELYAGAADVIVCDGFVGNVALKVSEGLAEAIVQFLKREIMATSIGRLGGLLLKPAFKRFKTKIDYAEYGGAPLLGIDGISIVSHGRSSPKAIKNAIRVAKESFEKGVNRHIQEEASSSVFYSKIQANE